MPTLEINGKLFAEQSGTGPVKLKIDELTESTANAGIRLTHPLKSSGGDEILSPSGTVSNLSKLSLTPSAAPSNPVQGDMYLDSSDNNLKIYTGSSWVNIANVNSNILVDYLVVAGGGGGWSNGSGGGGGGGMRSSVDSTGGITHTPENQLTVYTSTNYIVTVGAGGTNNVLSNNSNDSVFSSIRSVGGGVGGGSTGGYGGIGQSGGSGGGGGSGTSRGGLGGSGIETQGYDGGSGYNGNHGGGGGGGASAKGKHGGSNGGGTGGNGGDGKINSITGSSVAYSGGGGGGSLSTSYSGGTGGNGGGGRGGGSAGNPVSGTVNTGGGGGGGYNAGGSGNAAAPGGKGIVIISYLDTYPDLVSIDVSHTCRGATTVSGTTTPPAPSTARTGYKTYEFLDGDGNISW